MSGWSNQAKKIPEVKLIELTVGNPSTAIAPTQGMKVVPIAQAQPDLLKGSRQRKIEEFLQARSLAQKTQRNYRRQLQAFIDWVAKDWEAVVRSDLTAYKGMLEGRSLKITSVAAALTALKSMFTWLHKAGEIQDNPADAVTIPVIPETPSKHLEEDAVQKLFGALAGRKTEVRDRAILYLWFNAGLRPEEVTHLNVGDYNNVEISIKKAKHGSVGEVPTDDETHEALVAYLVQRSLECGGVLKEEDPIFVSYSNRNYGARISYEGVYKVFKEIAKAAGLENLHPHRGRHTFSSGLVDGEVDAYLAMSLTRQRSLKAFNTYNNQVRQKAARAAFWKAKGVTPRKPASVQQMLEGWAKG